MLSVKRSMLSVSRKTGTLVKRKSPEIMMAAGAVTFVAAIVAACKATIDSQDDIEEAKDELQEIRDKVQCNELTEKEAGRELTKVYLKVACKVAVRFIPAFIFAAASLSMMFASNHVLKERNAALASAYAAIDKAYKKYRAAVVEKYGEEEDYKLLNGIKEEEVEEEYTDKKGNKKTRKVKQEVSDPEAGDMYTRWFTPSHPEWKGSDELNEYWFRAVERAANLRLRSYYKKNPFDNYDCNTLSYNDLLESMSFDKKRYGIITGWRYDEENPSGDNEVKIKYKKTYTRNQYGDLEPAYILTFNVEGDIASKEAIDERRALLSK